MISPPPQISTTPDDSPHDAPKGEGERFGLLLTRVQLVRRALLAQRQQFPGVHDDVCVGRVVLHRAHARVVREGRLEDAEHGAAGAPLGEEALRQHVALLEGALAVLDAERADGAVAIEGDRLAAGLVVVARVVGVVHHLSRG